MAFVSFLLFHFLLIVHTTAAQQQRQSHIISLGSSISPPASWPSPSGQFAFGFYPQGHGFAVGIWLVTPPENTIAWTANRDDPPLSSNSTLELTKEGKLLVRTEPGQQKLISDISNPEGSASMLDSGNFVLYGSNSSLIIWQSFDHPTDTLLGGQNITGGNQLLSSKSKSDHSSGRFLLVMQGGNLVAYPGNSSVELEKDAYWLFSFSSFSVNLSLDYEGNLSLTSRSSMRKLVNNSYSTEKRSVIYRATLDADGIFRLYSHHFESNNTSTLSTEWVGLQDQCDVKGFCSLNSYCSSSDGKGECHCYPGFVPINSTNILMGCAQNRTEDACRKDLKFHYNMTSMENTWWSDYAYFFALMTNEDCSRHCQEDCNCGAALYEGGICKIYKLPLRYGRRNGNFSSTALFKVITGISESHKYPAVIQGKDNVLAILGMSLGSIALFCFAFALFTSFMYWRQVNSYKKLPENEDLGLSKEFALRSFSYSELEEATNNFNEELGRGSFGAVYRGTLHGGSKIIAVKRVDTVVEEGEREFRAEITTIGRTHHRNLVQLLGFCIEGSKKLLVYECMKNGSLADILFKADTRPIWEDRVRIALDVARGILYLHEECEVRIIHCNIKPQNILIDDSWAAKISDFGFAKLLRRNQTSITEVFSENRGYSAPEWQRSSLISVKADIYSYGVVLLEIICCRSKIDIKVKAEDEIMLSGWVNKCYLRGELEKLIGDENVEMRTFERMVKIGLWCIQDDPALRPPIKDVILMLEGAMEVPLLPSPAFTISI